MNKRNLHSVHAHHANHANHTDSESMAGTEPFHHSRVHLDHQQTVELLADDFADFLFPVSSASKPIGIRPDLEWLVSLGCSGSSKSILFRGDVLESILETEPICRSSWI